MRRPGALLAYGLAVAAITVVGLSFFSPSDWSLLGTRADGFNASAEVLDDGGPPLAGEGGERTRDNPRGYFAIGAGDDQGAYLYVPLVQHVFGIEEPLTAVRALFLALFFITIALYPLIFHALFRSLPAALAAPLALAVFLTGLPVTDIYWVPTWAATTLLPLLFLVDRRTPLRAVPMMMGLMVAASFASSIRSNAGLGVALAAAIVFFTRPWTWRRRGLAVALLVVAYLTVTPLGLAAVREYRDSRLDQNLTAMSDNSAHPVWHSIYIGLGYLPNDYKIKYLDEVAFATAKTVDPDIEFLSDEYEELLRNRWVDIATDNPGFVTGLSVQKVVVAVRHSGVYLLAILLVLPFALLLGPERQRMRRYLILTLPTALLAFSAPIVTVPFRPYELGFYGTAALVAILCLAWLMTALERARAEGPLRSSVRSGIERLRREPGTGPAFRAATRWTLALAAVFAILVVVAGPIEDRALRWQDERPLIRGSAR